MVCPAPRGSLSGNRVTAQRWASIFRSLGHRVTIRDDWRGESCDLLVALHARKSGRAALRFRRAHPLRPLVVVLTGTDVYLDLPRSALARRALEAATGIVALQERAVLELPVALRGRARTIHQSVPRHEGGHRRRDGLVIVVGHLRSVKDPFRAALASRRLPAESTIRVVQVGEARTEAMRRRAEREAARNPRYVWLGGLPRRRARTLLAGSAAMVISSLAEGGAHVIGEASVAGVPVLASRIPGNVGLLGSSYSGYFPSRDTRALARLLARFERDGAFRARLRRDVLRIAPLFDPKREARAWREFLADLERSTGG